MGSAKEKGLMQVSTSVAADQPLKGIRKEKGGREMTIIQAVNGNPSMLASLFLLFEAVRQITPVHNRISFLLTKIIGECLAFFHYQIYKEKKSIVNEDGSVDINVHIEKRGIEEQEKLEEEDRFEPCMVRTLEHPGTSFPEIAISGNDGGVPIRAHRAILGFRVEYFQKMFSFHDLGNTATNGGQKSITIQDLGSESLITLLRRIYGERFPEHYIKEEHLAKLLEIWHFCSVGLMEALSAECCELLQRATNPDTFSPIFRMAVLLDDTEMQSFLGAKMLDYTKLSSDALDMFTVRDMLALMRCAPSGLEALKWADSWVKHEKKERPMAKIFLWHFKWTHYPDIRSKNLEL